METRLRGRVTVARRTKGLFNESAKVLIKLENELGEETRL